MSVTSIRAESAREPGMEAMIIYNDVALAEQAKAILRRAAQRAGEEPFCSVKLWPLQMLNFPPSADDALSEAEKAHLIVFVVRPDQNRSGHLIEWLEQWALRRQIRDVGLAVFDGGNGKTGTTPSAPELLEFAERHGLDIFFGGKHHESWCN